MVILLSKFNFYGINGKDQALYQSYLKNSYFRTAVYNYSDNSNKPKLDMESHKALFWDLCFLFYIKMNYPRK